MKKNYSTFIIATVFIGLKAIAQCTPGCTTTISGSDIANHTIISGQKVCITSTGSVSGLITITTGGILCNEGAVNSPNLWVAGGLFNNYGSINTNQLMVSQTGDFLNEGTASIDSLLVKDASSTFINNGTLTNQRFTTAASATTTNNGTITSDFLYDSVGVFNNNGNVTVNFDIGVAYNSTFANGTNAYTRINRDFYNSTGATFNVGNCMITVGRDWYNSAIIAGPAGPSCGGFNIAGLSLNSGTVGSIASNVDLCDAGHPVTNIDGNSGTIASTTTYCTCSNNCVMVGITELIPSSNVIISNIYPNPAQTTVTFVLTNKQSEIVTIQVIDMMGRLVSTYNYKSSIGENKTELNVSNLKEGTYILSITDSQQLQTKRLFNITK
jgi:hypothetical protein